MAPKRSDQKMPIKIWMSENCFYPQNLKLSKNKIISLFIEHNNLWQTNYLLHVVVIWDKTQKAKVKKGYLLQIWKLPWNLQGWITCEYMKKKKFALFWRMKSSPQLFNNIKSEHQIALSQNINFILRWKFFMSPRPQPAGGIQRSCCPYVRTSVRPSVRKPG